MDKMVVRCSLQVLLHSVCQQQLSLCLSGPNGEQRAKKRTVKYKRREEQSRAKKRKDNEDAVTKTETSIAFAVLKSSRRPARTVFCNSVRFQVWFFE